MALLIDSRSDLRFFKIWQGSNDRNSKRDGSRKWGFAGFIDLPPDSSLSWLQTHKLSLQLSASDGSKSIKICLKRASTRTYLLLRPMRKHQAVTKMIVFLHKRSSFNLVSKLIYICIA